MPLFSRARISLLTALVFMMAAPGVGLAQDELNGEAVRESIARGIKFLRQKQDARGAWSDYGGQLGGKTALCTLALLSAGVPADDEDVKKAVDYLTTLKPERTYTVALQTMVFCLADSKKHLTQIKTNVTWLVKNQITGERGRAGSWSYGFGQGGGDPSNSQFALLALYEAERAGVHVPENTWKLAQSYWEGWQNLDGSFGYGNVRPGGGGRGSGSMTCAGIASLIITSGRLTGGDAEAEGNRVNCCKGFTDNTRIEQALAWLGRNFSVRVNPGDPNWTFYYLYGLERAGRMTARRFIDTHDWYREGAEELVLRGSQSRFDGSWTGRGPVEDDPVITTSYALLFLAKGRRPVLMAKFKHDKGDNWNRHRSDVANLTSYVEKKWARDLTWQVIDAQKATADDLLQAPVLFMNGQKMPQFGNIDEQAKVLRDYVDRGGFIFAEACCPGSDGFDEGFRLLMAKTFPEPEYKLRLLPPSHPIWNAQEVVPADMQRPLLCIDYGCRTSVVYCPPPKEGDPPGNLSCYWELSEGRNQTFSAKVKRELDSANSIGINVLAYATNRELKGKEETFRQPLAEKPKDTLERGKLYVAKLQHLGGCDAAPGALPNLLRAVGEVLKVRVDTEQRQIAISDPQLLQYAAVFMHGRQKFRLTAAERENLKQFLASGGTLLVDAICANEDFARSFRAEMETIFPKQLVPIEPNERMWTKDFGGFDVTTVTRREPLARNGGPLEARTRRGPPAMEGIKLGDRYAVIFSPLDLSCALEKHDTLECNGYTREDATKISINVLLYALHQ